MAHSLKLNGALVWRCLAVAPGTAQPNDRFFVHLILRTDALPHADERSCKVPNPLVCHLKGQIDVSNARDSINRLVR